MFKLNLNYKCTLIKFWEDKVVLENEIDNCKGTRKVGIDFGVL